MKTQTSVSRRPLESQTLLSFSVIAALSAFSPLWLGSHSSHAASSPQGLCTILVKHAREVTKTICQKEMAEAEKALLSGGPTDMFSTASEGAIDADRDCRERAKVACIAALGENPQNQARSADPIREALNSVAETPSLYPNE